MLLAQDAFLEASDFRGRSRRTLRLAVDASVGEESPSTAATIQNISETGLLLETPDDLPVGEWIGVDLPGTGLRSAQVVWASEHLFGCRFSEPVTPATVSAAILRSPFGSTGSTFQEPSAGADRQAPPRGDKMSSRGRVLTIMGLTTGLWVAISGLLLLITAS